jgi:tRNA threonylcarbamoyl adenosine modification protein YeaZ
MADDAGEAANGLVLALDAGSPLVSVAAGRGGNALVARAVALERSSTQLLALVAAALDEIGARPADLAGVVALAGPGSFTGLRVGLATALGLYQALAPRGLRAHAVPTLAALAAASTAPPGSLVIAAVDALRGEWSAQPFRAGPVPQPLAAMALVPAGELLRRLAPHTLPARDIPDPALPLATPEIVEIIAFGVAALHAREPVAARAVRFQEAPPLAPAALRLAAALPPTAWQPASLAAAIYSRPPATTPPRRRQAVQSATLACAIRPAVATDVPRLAELEAEAFADPWPPHVLAVEMCHPHSLMLVAAAAGGPSNPARPGEGHDPALGFATFRSLDAEAELLRVAVEPAARGHGIARLLPRGAPQQPQRPGRLRCPRLRALGPPPRLLPRRHRRPRPAPQPVAPASPPLRRHGRAVVR